MTTQVPQSLGRATLETMTTAPDSRSPLDDERRRPGSRPTQWDEPDDTTGSYDLEARGALRRVAGLSTELADVTEVEYRQLRLERVVLVGVWTEGTQVDADRSLAELAALAETAGSEVLEAVSQRRDRPDAATYVGSGKANEIRDIVAATGADTVICDGELTPGQLNQLEKILKVKVVDRTALILDIFAQHASSREGKAQVELAQMQYMLPRLRGWGESLSRQAGGRVAGGGGIGTRGPGETKIETDRRRIRARVSKLRKEIAGMATARATQRSSRDRNAVPSVAIAGYTNAGKSSLLNALTGAGVLVENALFATLDPTVRRAESPDGREYTLTDTVGFVRHLPAPAGRRVPLDAGGGGRRRPAAAHRRRLRPRPAGPDRRGPRGARRDRRRGRARGHRRQQGRRDDRGRRPHAAPGPARRGLGVGARPASASTPCAS